MWTRNRIGELRDHIDPVLDIGTLQALVGIGKGAVDLILDIPGFVDQRHQLADQDIPLVKDLTVKLSMVENAAYRLASNIKKTRASSIRDISSRIRMFRFLSIRS